MVVSVVDGRVLGGAVQRHLRAGPGGVLGAQQLRPGAVVDSGLRVRCDIYLRYFGARP